MRNDIILATNYSGHTILFTRYGFSIDRKTIVPVVLKYELNRNESTSVSKRSARTFAKKMPAGVLTVADIANASGLPEGAAKVYAAVCVAYGYAQRVDSKSERRGRDGSLYCGGSCFAF